MTRGSNRKDIPAATSTEWVDYNCPAYSWEYWEKRFAQAFSPELRSEICRGLADLRNYRKVYGTPSETPTGQRLDAKQIERELEKTARSGEYTSAEIARFVGLHSLDLWPASPQKRSKYVLEGFLAKPEEYLMERSEPNNLYTRVFYEMLHCHGMNVSLGSSGTLYGKGGMSAAARATSAPETPFVEFVRLILAESRSSSASYCAKIRKRVQRCPICSEL